MKNLAGIDRAALESWMPGAVNLGVRERERETYAEVGIGLVWLSMEKWEDDLLL